MGISKVIFGNETLIDLTADTITPEKLAEGYTAHDASGASIIGTASGGGSTSIELLWTNPTPSATFAAQTISLDLTNYDLFFIDFNYQNSGSDSVVINPLTSRDFFATRTLLEKGVNGYILCAAQKYNSNTTSVILRKITITNSGITFSTSTYATNKYTPATSNMYGIPLRIYGFKGSIPSL